MPEILHHPLRGTMELGSERIMPVFGNIRAAEGANDENPVLTIVGSDGSEDRHGSVINPRGWDTTSYLRNPVVLWSHGAVAEYPSLGETLALRSAGGKWEFDIRFALGPWRHMRDNLAAFLWEYYRDFGGTLASSISFIPKEWKEREATTIPTFFAENVEYLRQELTEISFVNVPSNRNALTKAVEQARSAGRMTDGLAKMLGYSVSPIILRGAAPQEPHPEDIARKRERASALRVRISEIVKRCCGCVEYYKEPTPEPISDEARKAEVTTLNELAASMLDFLDINLRGWKTTETDVLRNWCASNVSWAMSGYDWCAWALDEWFDEEIGATIPDINFEDLEASVSNLDTASMQRLHERAGAVLNSKNKSRLEQIKALADEVLASAAKTEEEEDRDTTPMVRITSGDAPREHGANSPFIRVLAPDAPRDRSGESPASGDLYRVLLND
jgi:hypothetical protein